MMIVWILPRNVAQSASAGSGLLFNLHRPRTEPCSLRIGGIISIKENIV